jgi:hypothetical protein
LIITCIEEHNQRIKKQRQRDERWHFEIPPYNPPLLLTVY